MQRYTFEPSFPSYDVAGFRWEIRDTGERIFAPTPHRMLFALGWTGLLVGVLWFAFAYFIPDSQMLMKVLFFIGACCFCVFGWPIGWLCDQFRQSSGPLLILKPDRSIELSRLKITVVPNETTHFELVRHIDDPKSRVHNGGYDLVLWHENQTYQIFFAAQPSWKYTFSRPVILTVDHLRSLKKLAPIEKLYMELMERCHGNLKTVARIQETQEKKYRTQIRQNAKRASLMPQTVALILGTVFTLAGGSAVINGINQNRLESDSIFLIAGVIFLIAFFTMRRNYRRLLKEETENKTP